MYILVALATFLGFGTVVLSAADANLIRLTSPVVDMHLLPNGDVRLYTQQFTAYDAQRTTGMWVQHTPTTGGAHVRRVSQVLCLGNTVLAFGHIITSDRAASVILRSMDYGLTFTPVLVGTDTLAITDGCTRSPDGLLSFVDRVGRLWMSSDDGVVWNTRRLPSAITPGAAREVDMIDAHTGVCIDGIRGVHFTSDAWLSLITPVRSQRPITRTQPSMLNTSNWARTFVVLGNTMYLTESGDVYRTATNDLVWERWDSVIVFSHSIDRRTVAYYTNTGRLITQKSDGSNYQVLDADALPPHVLRVRGDTVIAYRPDTGPVVYCKGSTYSIRQLNSQETIQQPTITASGSNWGILTNSIDAVDVDIVKRDGKGLWHRDTVATIGPIRGMYMLGADTVVFTTSTTPVAYVPSKRTIAPYELTRPLDGFLKHPVARFRILYASDELDSTHVRWVEYVTHKNALVCAELVDSSRFGVKSELIADTISQESVQALLKSVNALGESLPDANMVSITPAVMGEFNAIIDTIFSTDAYFDPYDMYKPPPTAEEQARVCRDQFREVTKALSDLNPATIASALRSFRHVPHDGHSRYVIEFQNRSGRIARFSVDRTDEAHPPLMLPWRGWADGRTWNSYDRGLTSMFLHGLPDHAVPPMFKELSREAWFLVGVASYLDEVRFGRRHRWSNRIISPEARF